jgi:hypothetical protein
MGQSATLYRIDKNEFARLEMEPSSFNIKRTLGHMTFEQNFEGVLFLLHKLCSDSERTMIQEIFFPIDSIGRKMDSEDFDILADLSFLETDSIYYLNKDKINSTLGILNRIDKHQFLDLYDPRELNDNGIYPAVWHSDESPNQAFNKRHIEEGFDKLLKLFNKAAENENLILAFVG